MIAWEFAARSERSRAWYLVAGSICLGLVLWGLFIGLYIMSVVVLVFAGVYVLVENNSPDVVRVEVDENGVRIGNSFYDYAKIEQFALFFADSTPFLLRLRMKTLGLREIDLKLTPDMNAAELRGFLGQYIPQDENAELSFMEQVLMRFDV